MVSIRSGAAAGKDASKDDAHVKYVSRDEALARLSDHEAARVTAAESLAQLAVGDEYLDLHHLDHGVRLATAGADTIGGVLPRKSIGEATWHKLIAQTPEPQRAATEANAMDQRGRVRRTP